MFVKQTCECRLCVAASSNRNAQGNAWKGGEVKAKGKLRGLSYMTSAQKEEEVTKRCRLADKQYE